MNSVGSNSPSFKYQRFTPSSCQDIGIRTFEFVAKTQFLYSLVSRINKKYTKKMIRNDSKKGWLNPRLKLNHGVDV